ncbi:MAG TPA: hypothetical protein VM166_09720 [Gemmatimonadaceae bacterium]|nr:hypothetical protein [Gemmatimonadaceae bacterium]
MSGTWMRLLVIASAALAAPAVEVGAQCTASGAGGTCNLPGSVSMTAGRVVLLQMSATSTTLTPPAPTDFDAGYNTTTGPTFTVSANAAWSLSLRSATALWSATNTSPGTPARTNKPAADLRWSTVAGGAYAPLTVGDVGLVNGVATPGSATTLYLRTLYDWTLDTPGNYSLSIVLTLTSP